MSDRTQIGWTDATWNPVVGCDRLSRGCRHCFAVRDAWRMAHNPNPKINAVYGGLVKRHRNGLLDWTGTVRCLPERLDVPLHWRKPRRIFVCDLSDLFHDAVPDEFVDRVFNVLARAGQHTFQVLTKRPDRMASYLGGADVHRRVWQVPDWLTLETPPLNRYGTWPLANVWIGTSCENQAAADERIPLLLQTPAALRFVSCEPLLGPIELRSYMENPPAGGVGLALVIAGCESGPRARPMAIDWVRSIRDQCLAAGVPFFLKQVAVGGRLVREPELDGRRWTQFPEVRP